MTSSGTARSTQINRETVGRLGLAWFADLDTSRGQEATPIVIDGNLYISTAWSMVKAYDGRTGRLLWSYDPEVPRERLQRLCCDAVNRGVAAWGDTLVRRHARRPADRARPQHRQRPVERRHRRPGAKLFDHRRAARHRRPGDHRQWRRRVRRARLRHRLRRKRRPPAVALLHRPRQPGRRLRRRASSPRRRDLARRILAAGRRRHGLGFDGLRSRARTCSISASATARPGTRRYRSEGRGDNLYLSSIVAIRPDTGEYVWHYQTTPGETWDFTATQHIILADLNIDGQVAQGADAGAEERLLLRARPHQRPASSRRATSSR